MKTVLTALLILTVAGSAGAGEPPPQPGERRVRITEYTEPVPAPPVRLRTTRVTEVTEPEPPPVWYVYQSAPEVRYVIRSAPPPEVRYYVQSAPVYTYAAPVIYVRPARRYSTPVRDFFFGR